MKKPSNIVDIFAHPDVYDPKTGVFKDVSSEEVAYLNNRLDISVGRGPSKTNLSRTYTVKYSEENREAMLFNSRPIKGNIFGYDKLAVSLVLEELIHKRNVLSDYKEEFAKYK